MKPDFNKYKILPAIIQNKKTKKILMQGWMNKESFDKTIETKKVWFFSRSKDRLWQKGESSENFLNVEQIKLDCDNDSILIQVTPEGPTCHTLNESCFDNELDKNTQYSDFSLEALEEIIEARKTEMPDNSYTTSLFNEGIKKITKKLGEEASEVIIASLAEKRSDLIYESADLIYHLLVLLANEDISLEEVVDELSSRHNKN
ncbi:MAG: bifunctional phosphoribosyl-AMP cyclohydrolase/phosphoribosyl-ATP diphosphatase HisIE [SAR202 cluster bacterium]|nr:bifunctional phosphoribosyl-AMP cyclohydrolase/phosphoribosyl-ATP diphosphatase HisIE [SAR202 cluster bacterium]|tara:strand:+ start:2780 stop:3388 length:609 start_codon:yes stop_codon:yes gene_type:complete